MGSISVLKLKTSLLISLASGMAFVGVLFFFPEKGSQSNPRVETNPYQTIPENPSEYVFPRKRAEKEESKDEFFKILLPSEINLPKKDQSIFYRGAIPYKESHSLANSNMLIDRGVGEIYSHLQSENLEVEMVSTDFRKMDSMLNNFSTTLQQDYMNRYRNLRRMEMNYKIHSGISANVQSVNSLPGTENFMLDDRIRVAPSTMAGLKFGSSDKIQAGFMTGESRLDTTRYLNQGMITYFQREQDYRDSQDRRNIFEMNTSVQPVKNVKFQTAVYNTNKAFLNESGNAEGARVSMLFGFQKIVLNVRYNYSSDNLLRGIRAPDAVVNAKDYAGVGVTFFLDSSKNYSLSIGNNYHNIVASTKYHESLTPPTVSSFSASFKGTVPRTGTTFFLNFRNQMSRDTYYSNIGLIRVPVTTQVFLDYATALGLEMSF